MCVVSACSAPEVVVQVPTRAGTGGAGSRIPGWLDALPTQCAIGMSRPRLHPLESVLFARLRARAAWVSTYQPLLTTHVDSIVVAQSDLAQRSGDRLRESTLLEWETDVRGVDVVSVWRDAVGAYGEAGSVWALACVAGTAQRVAEGSGPSWLWFTPPVGCTVASCGPVAPGDDQQAILQRRAQEAVSAVEGTHERVAAWTSDASATSQNPVQLAPSEELDETRVQAAGRGTFRYTWLDTLGEGPMGDGGRLYGLFCVSGRQ